MNYINLKEAAARCGIGYMTIYKAIMAGKLPAIKPGKRILVEPTALEAWLASTAVKPKPRRGRPRTNGPQAARRGA